MDDYERGIEKAKDIYRSIHPGGCRILSKGEGCTCFLCQCDREVKRHLSNRSKRRGKLDIDWSIMSTL